tara:strand:+ start:339 stop:1874 length:1536 start_codon:yes stop_codon:yes gene_type:complete
MSISILILIIIGLLIYLYNKLWKYPRYIDRDSYNFKEFKLDKVVNHKAMEITNPASYYDFDMIDKPLPDMLDLRSKCPPVYDQGEYGTCVHNSNGFLYHYYCKNVLKNDFVPSRFFLDYSVQKMVNLMHEQKFTDISISNKQNEGGSFNFEDIGILAIDGVCNEHLYPYPNSYEQLKHKFIQNKINELSFDVMNDNTKIDKAEKSLLQIQKLSESNIYKPPSREAYIDAKKHTINNLNIYRIRHDLEEMKKCLNYIGPISFDMKLTYYVMKIIYMYTDTVGEIIKIYKDMFKNEKLNKNEKQFLLKYRKYVFNNILLNKDIISLKIKKKDEDILNEYINKYDSNIDIDYNSISQEKINNIIRKIKKKTITINSQYFKDKYNYTLKFPTKKINKIKNTFKKYGISVDKLYNKQYIQTNYNIYLNFDTYFKKLTEKNSDLKQITQDIDSLTNQFGGHSMAIVGYDDLKKVFIVRNSWSEAWADKGYFYIDYEYFINRNAYGFNIGDMFAFGKL